MKAYVILLFALGAATHLHGDDLTPSLLSQLGTKAPYDDREMPSRLSASTPPPTNCELLPSSVQVLARHGARHTGKPSDLTKLGEELVALGSPLPWLQSYVYPGAEDEANNLIALGVGEHKGIGARLSNLLPPRFFADYNPNHLLINSTTFSRTGQSATSFCSGAEIISPFVQMEFSGRDDILRFYDHCEAWDDNTDEAASHYVAYSNTSEFQRALVSLSYKALLPQGSLVTPDQFNRAFEACAYDLILSKIDFEWCSLFDQESLKVANYVTDLKKFYSYGPGFEINRDFTAFLMKNIVDALESDIKGTLRFAHAETVIPFLSALGIFDGQEPLTTKRNEERTFKMNQLSPFSANVAILQYNCVGIDGEGDDYSAVKFLVNEVETDKVRGCNKHVFCKFSDFKASVSDLLRMAETKTLSEVCEPKVN